MQGPDLAIAAAYRKEAGTLLHELCDRAGITRANRHEQLNRYIETRLREAHEGDALYLLRSGAPSGETLKKDLRTGVPQRPIRATEMRVRLLDAVLNAHGRYISLCEQYWNALHPAQSGASETWYQITFPELDPLRGPVGRLSTGIDVAEIEIYGEEIHLDAHRIAPESDLDLRWRGTGVEREGYRFMTFSSLDAVRNRSFGVMALRRAGYAREEYFDGYYFRPADPVAGQPIQLERRRIAWLKSAPLGAWPRVALLDWDNTLHQGWTLLPWCAFLEQESLIPADAGLVQQIESLLAGYPSEQDHDELAAQTAELYARAIRDASPEVLRNAARRFTADPRRFRPFRWTDSFLRGLTDIGIAPVIISGAPVEVLAAWAAGRSDHVAGCFGLLAPNATSAAQPSEYLAAIVPGEINPGMTEGKQHFVGQIRQARRRVVLAVGDSASDRPLWEAAEYKIYVGTSAVPQAGSPVSLTMADPAAGDADELLNWVAERVGTWEAPTWPS